MGKQFTMPAVVDGIGSCSELTDENSDNVCCENTVLNEPKLLSQFKQSAARSGFKALLSPTGEISHEIWVKERSEKAWQNAIFMIY